LTSACWSPAMATTRPLVRPPGRGSRCRRSGTAPCPRCTPSGPSRASRTRPPRSTVARSPSSDVKRRTKDGVQFAYALNLSRLHRLSALRRRLSSGEQPRSAHESVLHPRARDGAGSLDMERGTVRLRPRRAGAGQVLHAGAVPAVRQPAVREGVPRRGHVEGADGIVVVDYNWCIGCRYCEAACPYHARRFNWTRARDPGRGDQPRPGPTSRTASAPGRGREVHVLSAPHTQGALPACLEACPTGARVFGNLLDPTSEIRWVLENKRVFVLKEELGTARASSTSSTSEPDERSRPRPSRPPRTRPPR
jgi:Fe-S-cluster-containing dehydrogenase component